MKNKKKKKEINLVQVQGGNLHVTREGQVGIQSFMISRFPVTQGLWKKIMGANNNPSLFTGQDYCPVESVTLEEVKNFLDRVHEKWQIKFRLPTTFEWLFAATGGILSAGYDFAGSDKATQAGWVKTNSDKTQPVGQKLANELGLYDMTGNVDEIVMGDDGLFYLCGGSFQDAEIPLRHQEGHILWPKQIFSGPKSSIGFRLVLEESWDVAKTKNLISRPGE